MIRQDIINQLNMEVGDDELHKNPNYTAFNANNSNKKRKSDDDDSPSKSKRSKKDYILRTPPTPSNSEYTMTTVLPDHPIDVNLNMTTIHSENILKNVEINKDRFLQLPSSTDFPLSSNLNVLLDASKNDQMSSKYLAPREPEDKDNNVKPIYTAVPVNTPPQYSGGLYQLLQECGIEYREATVVSQNNVPVKEVTTACQQDTQGHIIHGDKNALEMLAKDVVSLKTGTHGVITNPTDEEVQNALAKLHGETKENYFLIGLKNGHIQSDLEHHTKEMESCPLGHQPSAEAKKGTQDKIDVRWQ